MESIPTVRVLARVLVLLAAGMPLAAGDPPPTPEPAREETNMAKEGRNRLGSEASPYLLQHRDNPVWWYPWGEEAFEAARTRDMPIFLSVGYSTCHWCHVMEHESFEDEEVARVLNEGFVAIKVDREERPDVDAIYMDAVQVLTRRGGWPMSVFMTPEGKPFFAGTYFPREIFLDVLNKVREVWTHRRDQLEADAANLSRSLAAQAQRERAGELDGRHLQDFYEVWHENFDTTWGGLSGAPKFPQADDLRLLLRLHRRGAPEVAREMVVQTLDAMAAGGIYDHLGGGFARYSTDARWLVPHFEKMLYDQAQLVNAYLEAWQATGNPEYELVVRETLDYVLRDMTDERGGFYSAEDADSEGVEGKFYVWTSEELASLLDEKELELVSRAFGVTEGGNFEGKTILALQPGHNRTERDDALRGAMRTLLEHRNTRVRPHLDDKVLADWNGLMIAAFARAGRVLDEPRYVAAARKAAAFVLGSMREESGDLHHRWREGEAGIRGFLEDYAYMVQALVQLYQADFDPRWLKEATSLQARQDELFRLENGDYATTDGRDGTVLFRRTEFTDNVRPAGRSTTAMNLLQLGDLLADPEMSRRAARIFATTPDLIYQAPHAFSSLLLAADYALDRSKEVAIAGAANEPATRELIDALESRFLPNLVLAVGDPAGKPDVPLLAGREKKDGQPTAYVCENRICQLPVTEKEALIDLASTFHPLTTPD